MRVVTQASDRGINHWLRKVHLLEPASPARAWAPLQAGAKRLLTLNGPRLAWDRIRVLSVLFAVTGSAAIQHPRSPMFCQTENGRETPAPKRGATPAPRERLQEPPVAGLGPVLTASRRCTAARGVRATIRRSRASLGTPRASTPRFAAARTGQFAGPWPATQPHAPARTLFPPLSPGRPTRGGGARGRTT